MILLIDIVRLYNPTWIKVFKYQGYLKIKSILGWRYKVWDGKRYIDCADIESADWEDITDELKDFMVRNGIWNLKVGTLISDSIDTIIVRYNNNKITLVRPNLVSESLLDRTRSIVQMSLFGLDSEVRRMLCSF